MEGLWGGGGGGNLPTAGKRKQKLNARKKLQLYRRQRFCWSEVNGVGCRGRFYANSLRFFYLCLCLTSRCVGTGKGKDDGVTLRERRSAVCEPPGLILIEIQIFWLILSIEKRLNKEQQFSINFHFIKTSYTANM